MVNALSRWALAVLLGSLWACSSSTNRAPVVRPQNDLYLVTRGDTLYTIAFPRGLRYQDLARWNRIDPPYLIYPGQRLRLTGPLPPSEPRRLPTAAPSEPAVAAAPVAAAPPQQARPTRPLPPERGEARSRPAAPAVVAAVPTDNRQTVPVAVSGRPVRAERPTQTRVPSRPSLASRTVSGLSWVWPTKGRLLKGFAGAGEGKKGIDIGGKAGQPIVAASAGTIVYAGSGLRGYGKLIIIEHNKDYLSAYAHNRLLKVREGQRVEQGQAIAEMGRTGTSRAMLHFEIRRDGQAVDPVRYLP